ncbi:MAG: hypothetical protein BGO44_00450 [Legionella sp. 39-23]|nr:MAG: hypothetical protein BGO44_00450 [Legionella sp. 39-23]
MEQCGTVDQPSTRSLIKLLHFVLTPAWRTQFGLTFSEAIHIKTGIHIKKHKLSLTREITFNSIDRMIPIRNEIKKNILSDVEN